MSNIDSRAGRRDRLARANLYLVTDARRHIDPGFGELARFADVALAAGVDIIQLRDKGSAGERELGAMEAAEELAALAAEIGVYISAGIAEDDRGIHYNTQFLVGPEGPIGKQRKIHLSRDEYFYFRAGTLLPVLETPLARIGTMICFDMQFPETARCLAVGGAEIILAPHAARSGVWADEAARRLAVARQKQSWTMTLAARAHDNGTFVLACNTAGRSAEDLDGVEANHAGGCLAFDPYGQRIAESQSEDVCEEIVLVRLDGELVARRRREPCFNLQTRRPEVYGALVEPTA